MDEKCFGGIYGKEYPCCAGRRTTERKHRSAGGKLCKGHISSEKIFTALVTVNK